MPRYYKDTWSPDRNAAAKNLPVKKEDEVLQISPVEFLLDDPEDCVGIVKAKYAKIVLRGVNSTTLPPASAAISLLNTKHLLHSSSHNSAEFLKELDYLTALSFITGKRFVQACEILRKLESSLLGDTQQVSPRQKSLQQKVAGIEILVADCMNPHSQLYEKLNALRRACEVFQGGKVKPMGLSGTSKYSAEDIYTSLIRLHPQLVRVLLTVLQQDPSEASRMATLRCLDFVLENMGCSVGAYVIPILKGIIATYPNSPGGLFAADSFNISMMSVTASMQFDTASSPRKDTKKPTIPKDDAQSNPHLITLIEDCASKPGPKHQYSHLTETYTAVLGSVSSQILHKLFYEVLVPYTLAPELVPELRAVLLKVMDKVVGICQGDLVFQGQFLSGLLQEVGSTNVQLANAAQTLWNTIKTRLFPGSSPKTKKQLVSWVHENLVGIAERMVAAKEEGGNNTQVGKGHAEEEAMTRLGIFVELARILAEERPVEDPNSLVLKKVVSDKTEVYVLLNPLLYWINHSLSAETTQFDLFKQVWPPTAALLKSMKATLGTDTSPIFITLLSKPNEHMKHSSPTLPMLQYVSLIAKDMDLCPETTRILHEILEGICSHIPSYPFEEIFGVLQKLLEICAASLTPSLVSQIIAGLTDKYTIKSKKQQEVLKAFIDGVLLRPDPEKEPTETETTFDVAVRFCMTQISQGPAATDNKRVLQQHEKFVEKLGFLLETVRSLSGKDKERYRQLIFRPELGGFLEHLATSGHSAIRLKAHEMLDLLCNYYVTHFGKSNLLLLSENSGEGSISQEQLVLAKLVLSIAKKSFENSVDSYMQFNALILMDLVYQWILPIPPFSVEIVKPEKALKSPAKKPRPDLDLESLNVFTVGGMKATEPGYLHMRMLSILKVWPCVQVSLGSPWSNIRSITYGLICSMLKVDTEAYCAAYKEKLKSLVQPVIISLLGSKESESKAGGLNILGSIAGFSYEIEKTVSLKDHLKIFKRNSEFVSVAIWEKVFELQADWDVTIKEAATVLIQLAAPKEAVVHFEKVRQESKKLATDYKGKLLMPSNAEIGEKVLIETDEAPVELSFVGSDDQDEEENEGYFYIEKYDEGQVRDIISIFRNDFKPPKNLWIEKNATDSLAEYEVAEFPDDLDNLVPAAKSAKPPANELPLPESENRRFVDVFEDKLVEHLSSGASTKNHTATKLPAPKEPSVPLQPDLHKKDSLDAEPYKFFNSEDELNQDNLEIIDLEEEDFLKSLEDDKVPVLKNTYADKKSNRPSAPKPGTVPSTVKIDLRAKIGDSLTEKSKGHPKKESENEESAVRLKKQAGAAMRPANGLRPITPPLKIPEEGDQKGKGTITDGGKLLTGSESKEKALPNSDDKGKPEHKENAPTISGHKETAKSEHKPAKHSEAEKWKGKEEPLTSQSFFTPCSAGPKDDPARKSLNKSFDNHQSARIPGKAVPKIVVATKGKTKLCIAPWDDKAEVAIKKAVERETHNQSTSLPTTPTGAGGRKIPITLNKGQSPMVGTTLFKDLKLFSKKKHKRQPQQHLAQTSPALVAILKSINQPAAKKAPEEIVPRSERTRPTGRKIILQGKIQTPKMECTEGIVLRQARKVFPIKHREKSKSEAISAGGKKAADINLTADQIKLEERDQRDLTPMRNNYVEEITDPASLLDTNKTY